MTGRMWLALVGVSVAVTFGLVMLTARVMWPHIGPLVAETDGGVCGLIGLACGFVAALAVDR